MPRWPQRSDIERFWSRVSKTEICWLRLDGLNKNGYATFKVGGRMVLAHRWIYEQVVGPIPPGHTIDHVKARGCTHLNCVNPAHLEAVTHGVNILRGDGRAARQSRQTHCKRGHPLIPDNIVTSEFLRDGRRRCRACLRLRHPSHRERSVA